MRRSGRVGRSRKAHPDQQVYEFDPATGQITFGDGVHGAAVPLGFRNVVATYEAISDSSGVIAADAANTLINSAPFVTGVTNPQPGSGGTGVGSQARGDPARTADLPRRRNRAVTTADYALMATQVAGIVGASTIAGRHPTYPGRPIPESSAFTSSRPTRTRFRSRRGHRSRPPRP